MKRRSREISVFSTSAIDLFASAMGAFIIIALVLIVNTSKNIEETIPPNPPPPPPPAPTPPVPLPTPPDPVPPVKGLPLEVPLGLNVYWKGRGVDIDLYVSHDGSIVSYKNPVTRWGILARDENTDQFEDNRETFFMSEFTPDNSTGTFQVYLAFFDWNDRDEGPGPFPVHGTLFVFPGTPREQRHEFQMQVERNHAAPPDSATGSPLPVFLEFQVVLPPGASGTSSQDFQVRVR
jgi:hypothetical protein